MKTYTIKLQSPTNSFVVTASLVISVMTAVVASYKIMDERFIFSIAAAAFIIGFFLRLKLVTGRTEWTINNNEIIIVWTKKIPFANCKDLLIKWTEVAKIRTSVSIRWQTLDIFLSTGHSLVFYRDDLARKNDFEQLINALNRKLNEQTKP